MKFLFVTEYYPPFIMGGAEISLKILIENLIKNNHKVTILTPNYSSFKTQIEEYGNLKIIRFKSLKNFLFKRRKKTQEIYKKTKPFFYLIVNQYIKYSSYELKKNLQKLLNIENKFDIIHANNLESILALNSIKTTAKKVAHLRDFGLFCYNRGLDNNGHICDGCSMINLKSCMNGKKIVNKLLLMEIKRRVELLGKLSSFDLIIAISNFVKDIYVTILNIDEKKIRVLYNPMSNEIISTLSKKEARKLLNLPEDRKIILFVGSLIEKKGAHLIPKIAKELNECLFIIIGDGPLKDLFLQNKQNNIIYLRYISTSKLKHYYKASDILLIPSLWYEPFGRVVLEGAYNGCYVIGSNKGGIPEVIDWLKCGTYVGPTVENFVKKIKEVVKSNQIEELCRKNTKIIVDYGKEFLKLLN